MKCGKDECDGNIFGECIAPDGEECPDYIPPAVSDSAPAVEQVEGK